jgi:hypothetical protein
VNDELDSLCIICHESTDFGDDDSIMDVAGIICGKCAKRLDITLFDVLPCVRCGWPSFDNLESPEEDGLVCKFCSPPPMEQSPGRFYGPLCWIEGEENV